MYTKDDLNALLRDIAKNIDISDDMFEAAEKEYKALGKWIDDKTPNYEISIYPQGSFGLGTVVRPISNADDYDLDIVCQFAESYDLSARELKIDVVKPLLVSYRKSNKELENKRRCWHVDYDDVPQFHMDVVPAYAMSKTIRITNHDEEMDTYSYMGSNPSGYITWFFEQCAKQRERLYQNYIKEHRMVVMQADIEDIKRRKVKTPLQRVVQLLKRHRDIMFKDDESGVKPISIIITTMAASLYQEEDNIVDAMNNILIAAPKWIRENMKDGQYYIENPSFARENFAEKWNEHPERAKAFFDWLRKATEDIANSRIYSFSRVELGNHIKRTFGDKTGIDVISDMAEKERAEIASGTRKVDPSSGKLSTTGVILVPTTHHYGE